jgi:hypothetical protein
VTSKAPQTSNHGVCATRGCLPGRRKLAVKVLDIFGNDIMTIVDVSVGGKK